MAARILTRQPGRPNMPRSSKPAPRPDSGLRRAIASAAARLMAEEGIGDYGSAKRKAARQLGAGQGEALPTNDEIESELRAYQAIYQEDEQRLRLRDLRSLALEVMRLLEDFRPYLTGAVLDGTAGRYAETEIDVFADSAKEVEIFLLSHHLVFDVAENRRLGPDAPEARLRLDWDGEPVLLSVYPTDAERQRRKNPHTGRSAQRARASAVVSLLEETAS
jgi:hypothetical protein